MFNPQVIHTRELIVDDLMCFCFMFFCTTTTWLYISFDFAISYLITFVTVMHGVVRVMLRFAAHFILISDNFI